MTNYRIVSNILSADSARLDEEVAEVIHAGVDLIHLDVVDNHCVPNLTFGPMVCAVLKPRATVPADVYLVIGPADDLIHTFTRVSANIITFHPEASRHVDRSLGLVKKYGCQAGLVLNPATPVNTLEDVLDKLDIVLLTSVNPGFGGQSFIPNTLVKVRKMREMLDEYGWQSDRHIALGVDGGMKADNVAGIAAAGADTFAAGSTILGKPDYKVVIDETRQQLAQIG